MYAAVVAGRASPQQPSGPPKATAKSFDISEHAASFEVANRRNYSTDVSRPLLAPLQTPKWLVVSRSRRRANQQDTYLCLRRHGHAWLPDMVKGVMPKLSLSPDQGGESRGEIVPRMEDGFRATASALRSLMGAKVWVFLFLSEDRCMRLLVKNLGT